MSFALSATSVSARPNERPARAGTSSMEKVADDTRRSVVAECKHTDTAGRPVVQKLHSAVVTFDFDSHKRGMVVTPGPAREYATSLQ